jgi:hypothetical protein
VPATVGVPLIVIVFEAQVAVTPEGRPVGVPIPVARVVVWVMGVRAVLRHTEGVEEGAEAVLAMVRQLQTGTEGVPRFISMQLSVVLNTSKPVAGLAMALRCAVLRRGGSSPPVVLCTSSSAEGVGVIPPMTTCAGSGVVPKAKSR